MYSITSCAFISVACFFHGWQQTYTRRSCRSGCYHSIAVTMDTYSHLMPNMQADATTKLDAAFRVAQAITERFSGKQPQREP